MKQFKAESKRLMELMINSIYTHKEIFLRELISNASDALDKLYYKQLTENAGFDRDNFYIELTLDKEARTLTISDTGIGMDKTDMEENLGVIAHSGSLVFKEGNDPKEGVDIIGQFGVGFYSSFMVSDTVTVRSKVAGADTAYEWVSKGVEGYTIKEIEKETSGTEVILHIKADTEDEKYGDFLEDFRLKSLVKKYSDFIKYPIRLGEETLNSMVPIWRKNKSELTKEDYEQFYQDKHFGFEKPLRYAHISAEGVTSYKALLYIPARTSYDYYTKEFQKGLELYTNGVLIMEKCADLLPDYFGFVQGLVDSADLSLNISRELLQHDRQLKLIARRIKDKIKAELLALREDDRDAYDEFFKNFGRALKFGVYSEWGMHKEDLQELLMFYSSTEKKLVSLQEYVSRMPETQNVIYYATGDSIERIEKLPQIEFLSESGSEILFFTEDVDEFAVRVLGKYAEKEFKSVQSGDLDIPEEKKESDVNYDDIFAFMTEKLAGKVKEVRASKRLKRHPVCLIAGGEMSIEMEKVLGQMPGAGEVHADKILEVNTGHTMFASLERAFKEDNNLIERYTNILYNQALLIEGLPIEDPVGYANDVCELIK